jgi:hypothetical protein
MFPKLVTKARTPVQVVIISEEPNEFGERPVLLDASFSCSYQDAATVKYTADKQATEITGTIFIDGDILPGSAIISSGYVVIFGEKREIKKGSKARNLDGSVNYTRLDVV